MRIRKDCLHYHEEPYMGARVDCCLAETAFGVCPCTPDCEKYIPRDSSVRIVRCKDCENWQTDWNPSIPDRHYCAVMDSMMKADDFCSYGERMKR